MGKTIIVATDTSAASHDAAKWAADNLFAEGDLIQLVHCFSALKPAVGYVPTEKEQEMWRQEQSECLKKEAEAIKTAHPEANLRAVLIEGDPREILPRYAKEQQAVAIVVGHRGHGALHRALLGSVSTHLSHHSDIPVTIVRHKEEKKEAKAQ